MGVVLVGLLSTVLAPDFAGAAPVQISYITAAHPDDEFSLWSLVTGSTGNYKAMIYLTQGEQSSACQTAAEGATTGAGPYWYQGPTSPVLQPNYGEINPVGATLWAGRWTALCREGRRNSTMAWLDAKAASDGAIPNGFTLRGTYSFPGNTSAGLPPQRFDGTSVPIESRTATVYDVSNGMGKLIFFDLGDGDLTKEEARWALEAVRNNKATLGIPTTMPDTNAIAPYRHDGSYSNCATYDHPDHAAAHQALWNYDMINGKQYGRTCATDPDVFRTNSIPTAEYNATIAMSGTQRVGVLQTRYGWLEATYFDNAYTCSTCLVTATQSFWGRFG
jgi:hypothetical protein